MTKQVINVGTTANDKKGDSLRAAFQKVNANFTELYTALGLAADTTLNLGSFEFVGSTMTTTDSSGITIDQIVNITSDLTLSSDVLPSADNIHNIGSPSKRWRHGYFANGSLYIGDIKLSNDSGTLLVQQVTDAGLVTEAPVPNTPGVVTTDRIISGDHTFSITAAGGLELDGSPFTGSGNSNQLVNSPYNVTLDVNGNTTFPSQTYIRQNNSYTRTVNGASISGIPTVIWSGTNDNITSVKMTIQIEGYEGGDTSGWHTQTCEAVIADRYWGNAGVADPVMSVYGIVHTSIAPLVTFTIQRNATTHLIEVVGTPTVTSTGTLYPKIHSVETSTRD